MMMKRKGAPLLLEVMRLLLIFCNGCATIRDFISYTLDINSGFVPVQIRFRKTGTG